MVRQATLLTLWDRSASVVRSMHGPHERRHSELVVHDKARWECDVLLWFRRNCKLVAKYKRDMDFEATTRCSLTIGASFKVALVAKLFPPGSRIVGLVMSFLERASQSSSRARNSRLLRTRRLIHMMREFRILRELHGPHREPMEVD